MKGFFLSSVLLLVVSAPSAVAQCVQSKQPPQNDFALKPGVPNYYAMDSSLSTLPSIAGQPTPLQQIQSAILNWNTAETGTGGPGTTLQPATASNPATVTFNSSQTPGPASLGFTNYMSGGVIANSGQISATNPATVMFYPQSFIQGTSFNAIQVTKPGYGTMYENVAAHEIGHLMGIGDYPDPPPAPGPGVSVVEPTMGVNDIGDTFQKLGPTQCDIAQTFTIQHLYVAEYGPQGPGFAGPGGHSSGVTYYGESWTTVYYQTFSAIYY